MSKVFAALVAISFIGASAQATTVRTRTTEPKTKTVNGKQINPSTSAATSALAAPGATASNTATKVFKAATCSPEEFANELARRGKGDSNAIIRQMKIVGVGTGVCDLENGGLLGTNKKTDTPNYTDSQLETLVKILNVVEQNVANNMELVAAEEAAYKEVTGADDATARAAVTAFRSHCKIFGK